MKYVADDGTEFTTEQECLSYENRISELKGSFIMLDVNLIQLNSFTICDPEYIYIIKQPEEVADYLYSQYGLNGIKEAVAEFGAGLYFYDWDDYNFQSIDKMIFQFEDRVAKLKAKKAAILNSWVSPECKEEEDAL